MWSIFKSEQDHLRYASSVLERVPVVKDIQARFDFVTAKLWLGDFLPWCAVICIAYVLLVLGGRKWMSSRPAYDLKRSLFIWNTSLALFSLFGVVSILPHLIHVIMISGVKASICTSEVDKNPHLSLWAFLFVISKVLELGDTAFIVLRKSPLQFLHWYHHITVLLYSFFGLSRPKGTSIGIWFGTMNYSVHTAMYTYFAVRAAGYSPPSIVSKCITIFQLSQMIVALYINYISFRSYSLGEVCDIDLSIFYVGLVIYGSYALLFMHFFYVRYIRKAEKTKKE
jgi:elongation of very long chain fatty acids protein 6